MLPYASEDEALFDVLRLAKGMTYKSAVADTGLGGGKSVILGDPKKTWDFKFPAFAPSGDRIVAQEDSGQVPHLIGITSAGEHFRSFWWDIGWGAQIQPDWGPVQR